MLWFPKVNDENTVLHHYTDDGNDANLAGDADQREAYACELNCCNLPVFCFAHPQSIPHKISLSGDDTTPSLRLYWNVIQKHHCELPLV